MWWAYAHTSRWSSWAPQIQQVRPDAPLRTGLRGRVDGILGIGARFEVTSVDEAARRWSWDVAVGPARLSIDHEVDEGIASIDVEGPGPVVLAYAPVARAALGRLVRRADPADGAS